MRLDGALRHPRHLCNLIYRESIHQLQRDACSFILAQYLQGIEQIHLQSAIHALRILPGHCRRINILRRLMTAVVIIPHVIGDAVKPSGELCRTLETRQMGIGLDKGILSQVVTQLHISQRLTQEKPTNR